MKRVILYAICLPWDLIGWAIVLTVRMLWGHKLKWYKGVLMVELSGSSWPSRTWYSGWGGTTFGHSMMFAYEHMDIKSIVKHEFIHVEQVEAGMVYSLSMALVVFLITGIWWLPLVIWTTGGAMMAGAGFLTAWLRDENPYSGSHTEEAAYAQDDEED